jgi:hypothetical protein
MKKGPVVCIFIQSYLSQPILEKGKLVEGLLREWQAKNIKKILTSFAALSQGCCFGFLEGEDSSRKACIGDFSFHRSIQR